MDQRSEETDPVTSTDLADPYKDAGTPELVNRLVAESDWPEPSLLDAIYARGQEAVKPLLDVLNKTAGGPIDGGDQYFALCILGDLRVREAIPGLCQVLRDHGDSDLSDHAANVLSLLGTETIDPLLEVVCDRSLKWQGPSEAARAAVNAADDDPEQQSRVAEVLRNVLSDILAHKDNLSHDDFVRATFLVDSLCDLADPLARDLIDASFKAEIVDRSFITEHDVEEFYSGEGRKIRTPVTNFIDGYRFNFRHHHERLRKASEARPEPISRTDVAKRAMQNRPAPVKPKHAPGRNDPCWCGSGKKYKKCHMRLEGP